MSSKYSQRTFIATRAEDPQRSKDQSYTSEWNHYDLNADDVVPKRSSSRRSRKKAKQGSLGVTILGAIAGGFLGHRMGDGDKLASIAGAAIGAYSLRRVDRGM